MKKTQSHCDIGQRLRQLRKENCMTQQELADYLFVSVDSVSGYENGRIALAHDYIEKLCYHFHVSADYFYFGQQKKLQEDDNRQLWEEYFDKLNEEEQKRAIEIIRLSFPSIMST